MATQRQQSFQQLRTPCIELSAVALKFRAKQASAKQVFIAIQTVYHTLTRLIQDDSLDEKLAEYAFFPLTHVYNNAQQLSSATLEIAVDCTSILVSKGWRLHLPSAMAKQLLILMTLIAGENPEKQVEIPSDDLKAAAYECIKHIVLATGSDPPNKQIFDDHGSERLVDQLVYILLESVEGSPSDRVQVSASQTLLTLLNAISSHILLASLLPRTVSSLTKALRPSTQIRRTRKALVLNLELLTAVLRGVLSDEYLFDQSKISTHESSKHVKAKGLDIAWLEATAPQVKSALVQVLRLQAHESPKVRDALADLCFMVCENCPISLKDTLPLATESLVSIAQNEDVPRVKSALKHIQTSRTDIANILEAKFYQWCQAIPRTFQMNDDRSKQNLIGQLSCTFSTSVESLGLADELLKQLSTNLLIAVSGLEYARPNGSTPKLLESNTGISYNDTTNFQLSTALSFSVLLSSTNSQKQGLTYMQNLLDTVASHGKALQLARHFIDEVSQADNVQRVAATWLALNCLRANNASDILTDDVFANDEAANGPYLVSKLYASVLPWLLEEDLLLNDDWRLTALSLECVVLQAKSLGVSYRPELLDTLYLVVSLLGSTNQDLQNHAIIALNMMTVSCQYRSIGEMLIRNVDYLINAIAMKLNAFDISPQGPQVLLMMIKLCGAQVIPYLDDTIGSIFSALDNFHGYPLLVDVLFQILRAIVAESQAQPIFAITDGQTAPNHKKEMQPASTLSDVLGDMRRRRSTKRKFDEEHTSTRNAPHAPWSSVNELVDEAETDQTDQTEVGEEAEQVQNPEIEPARVLSKTHKLLLSIANATIPHLASPSAKVRKTLLELLTQVCTLLAHDENSFLPFINSAWPAITARLFLHDTDDVENSETAYNICGAAETVTTICTAAGDFMSSRIETIFPQLENIFSVTKRRLDGTEASFKRNSSSEMESGGVMQIILTTSQLRTADGQIMVALVKLLCAIISHIRLSDDHGSKISTMVVPYANVLGLEVVGRALDTYNPDAFWLQSR